MKKIDLVKLVKEVDKEEMIEGGVHKIFALTCLYKFIEMQEAAINYTHSCKSDSEQLLFSADEIVSKINEQTVLDGETFRVYFCEK
jgi:hypothetical protein